MVGQLYWLVDRLIDHLACRLIVPVLSIARHALHLELDTDTAFLKRAWVLRTSMDCGRQVWKQDKKREPQSDSRRVSGEKITMKTIDDKDIGVNRTQTD